MKFSIRDLLLVTVIVALGVGWWVERRARLTVQAEQAEERIKQEIPYRKQQAALRHPRVRAGRAAGLSGQASLTSLAPAPNPPKP